MLRAPNADKHCEFAERQGLLGKATAKERPMIVFVYVNTSKQVGDPEHIKVFATPRKRGLKERLKALLSNMMFWLEPAGRITRTTGIKLNASCG